MWPELTPALVAALIVLNVRLPALTKLYRGSSQMSASAGICLSWGLAQLDSAGWPGLPRSFSRDINKKFPHV